MKQSPNHHPSSPIDSLQIISLGRIPYDDAYALQCQLRQTMIDARTNIAPPHSTNPSPLPPMKLLLLEHDPPVITVSKRPGASAHIIASPEHLNNLGIEVKTTDRGGDITYHGPGQLVAYAILDLKRLHLGVHEYMRTLEQIVINTLEQFNIKGIRDPHATGVWIPHDTEHENRKITTPPLPITPTPTAKICAMGVRISRWITMHGLALNVTTDLSHFRTIIPCGLTGRSVTSIENIIKSRNQQVPTMDDVKNILADEFINMVTERLND